VHCVAPLRRLGALTPGRINVREKLIPFVIRTCNRLTPIQYMWENSALESLKYSNQRSKIELVHYSPHRGAYSGKST